MGETMRFRLDDYVLLLLCVGWIYFITQSVVWTIGVTGYLILVLAIIKKIQPYLQHFLLKYVYPDWLFINWYRCGIMDEESYKYIQENGYMEIDLDPEHIEQQS